MPSLRDDPENAKRLQREIDEGDPLRILDEDQAERDRQEYEKKKNG